MKLLKILIDFLRSVFQVERKKTIIEEVEDIAADTIKTDFIEPVEAIVLDKVEAIRESEEERKYRFLWCIDNGHGKLQKGKRSPVFEDGRQFLEYEFNRDIAERIMLKLRKIGVPYFDVVPDYNQVGSFLKGRVDRANLQPSELPKIYVSIHANASGTKGWGQATGIETWFSQNSKKGKKIAAIFQKHLIQETGWRNRHLKSSAITDLYVLRNTWMPAILTENGFFNNKEQAADLMKDEVRQRIADAHVFAILEIEKNGL